MHLRKFRSFREKQKKNLDEWNRLQMLLSSGQDDATEFERLTTENEKNSETLEELKAENARLVAEEHAILHPGLFDRFARLFSKADEAELEAVAQIKRNASAREAKNHTGQ